MVLASYHHNVSSLALSPQHESTLVAGLGPTWAGADSEDEVALSCRHCAKG